MRKDYGPPGSHVSADKKVDYTFLYRQEAARLIDKLTQEGYHELKDLEAVVKHLNKMEEHAFAVISDRFKQAESSEASVLTQVLMMMDDPNTLGEKVSSMLFDSRIPDRNKSYLLKVLEFHGLRPEVFSYEEIFNNPEKAIRDARKSLYKQLSKNPGIIPQLLGEIVELSPGTQSAVIQEFLEEGDVRMIPLLKSIALLDDYALSREAVKGLGGLEHPKSKTALKDILKDMNSTAIHPLVEKEISRLNLKGVRDESESDSTDLEQDYERLGDLYDAAISQLDGRGNRLIWIARRWHKGKRGLLVINFVVNLKEGLKDCWGYYRLPVQGYKHLLSEFRDEAEILTGDPNYVRDIFKYALHQNRSQEIPKPGEFAYWRQFLDDSWLKPEPYTTAYEDTWFDKVTQEKELYRLLWTLHQHDDFYDWFLHDPYVYDLVEDIVHMSKRGEGLVVPMASQEVVEGIHEKLIKEMILPHLDYYREALLHAARFQEKKKRSRIFRTILLAVVEMKDGSFETIRKHPFFIGMVKRSLSIAARNIQNGLDLRKNPEDFEY